MMSGGDNTQYNIGVNLTPLPTFKPPSLPPERETKEEIIFENTFTEGTKWKFTKSNLEKIRDMSSTHHGVLARNIK
jgi:hypothetical protein